MSVPVSTRGFTLLELVVAIGLLGVLVAAVFGFTFTLFDREARTLDEAAASQMATMLFDRLEADLLGAIASTGSGAGLAGDAERLTVAHRSVLPGSASAPVSDLQRTVIGFDRRAGRVSLSRAEVTGPSEPDAGGAYPVPVRLAQFRYHDGDGWNSSHDSARGLPVAVELAIWFGQAPGAQDEAEGAVLGAEEDELFGDPVGFDDLSPSAEDMYLGDPLDELDPFLEGAEGDGSLGALPAPDRVRVITIPDARLPRAQVSGGAGS